MVSSPVGMYVCMYTWNAITYDMGGGVFLKGCDRPECEYLTKLNH